MKPKAKETPKETQEQKPVVTPAVVTEEVVTPAIVTAPATPDLEGVADLLLQEVPENMKALIPNIDPAAQIAWFTTAKTAGAFSTGTTTVPLTDSGKPTVTPVETNLNDQPVSVRMSAGYSQ